MSAISGITVPATVECGKPTIEPLDRRALDHWLKANEGARIDCTFAPHKKPRSNRQNRTYWGLVLPYIADETGHTTEEVHEFMKTMYLPRRYIEIGGREREVGKSTTDLSTAEFEEYLERIRAFAANELYLAIPMPNEDC